MDEANVILGLLYDRRDFVSMHELAMKIGGGSLEPALAELTARGHEFERQPDRGLRLVRPTRLDAYLIERDLNTDLIGRSVVCFDQVDSTNDVVMASAARLKDMMRHW